MIRPLWASPRAARAAVEESRVRQERVNLQSPVVRLVTWRLSQLGQKNHFQESVLKIFGEPK